MLEPITTEAVRKLRKVIAISSGTILKDAQQFVAAIADYNEAIRLKPDYAFAYNNRGSAKAAQLNQYAKMPLTDFDMRLSELKPELG